MNKTGRIMQMFCSLCSDLGAHVDGFIAVAAHTLVIGASKVNQFAT